MFREIESLLANGQHLTIVIARTEGVLAVSTLIRSDMVDDAQAGKLIPIVLSGTAEEFDRSFIQMISTPIQRTSSMLSNMEAYEKKLKEAEKNSKASKDGKSEIDKLLKSAESLEGSEKLKEALQEYKKVIELDKYNGKANTKVNFLNKALNPNDLFANQSENGVQVEAKQEEQVQIPSPLASTNNPQQAPVLQPFDAFAELAGGAY